MTEPFGQEVSKPLLQVHEHPPAPAEIVDEIARPWLANAALPDHRLRRLAGLAWTVVLLPSERQPEAIRRVDIAGDLPPEDGYVVLGVFARMVARAADLRSSTPPGRLSLPAR